jgi:hypothetical protein
MVPNHVVLVEKSAKKKSRRAWMPYKPALVDADAFRCKLAALSLMSPSGDS